MNIVMLALGMCVFMLLHAADRNAIIYNEARRLPRLTQPLPPYPWDASTTERFIEHFDPACAGQCSSVALPIQNDIPCSFAQCNNNFITRMQNNGFTATSCCQRMFCASGTGAVVDVGGILCSSGSISPDVVLLATGCMVVLGCTFLIAGFSSVPCGNCITEEDRCTYKLDRDYMRSAIAFYSMHARLAQERQPLLAKPIVPVMDEFRDAVDEQS